MEILKPKSDVQKLNILLKAYNTKLNVYFRMGNMKKCLQLIPEIELLLEKNKDSDKLLKEIIYWQVTSLLMIAEEYKQALKWLGGNYFSQGNRKYSRRLFFVLVLNFLIFFAAFAHYTFFMFVYQWLSCAHNIHTF